MALASVSALAAAASIDPPDGTALLVTTASGVQIYSCEYDASHALGWVFKSPRATLYNASGLAVIEHFAGPSWEAKDGSSITGHVLAQMPSDTPGSVPQLLLEAKRSAADGMLATVRYVQRSKTVGGAMPAAPCTTEHALGNSPYLATYTFFK